MAFFVSPEADEDKWEVNNTILSIHLYTLNQIHHTYASILQSMMLHGYSRAPCN